MFYSEAGVICAECSLANVRFKPLVKFNTMQRCGDSTARQDVT